MKSERAFNLIELLVTVGIIGVLSSLLLPALCKAKAQARANVCKNNLRQLGFALAMYVGDFHNYPSAQDWIVIVHPGYDRRVLSSLAQNGSALFCPDKRWPASDAFARISYGYNGYGGGQWGNSPLGLGVRPTDRIAEAQVKIPADMIAIGDSGAEGLPATLLNPNVDLYSSGESASPAADWLPSGRHQGSANVLFCDGHLESAALARWIEKSDRARQRWNNDHEPHPETW